MSWNYRLMVQPDGSGGIWFEIHEVYYNEEGKPESYTTNPTDVSGNNINDIIFTLNEMRKVLNTPTLWMGDKFPEEFDYDKWIKNKKL